MVVDNLTPIAVHYRTGSVSTNLDLAQAAIQLRDAIDNSGLGVDIDALQARFPGLKTIDDVWPEQSAFGFAVGINGLSLRIFIEMYQLPKATTLRLAWQINIALEPGAEIPKNRCPVCTRHVDVDVAQIEEDCTGIAFCLDCYSLLEIHPQGQHQYVRDLVFHSWPYEEQIAILESKTALLEAVKQTRTELGLDTLSS